MASEFAKIVVVGVGLIGGSFSLALKAAGAAGRIVGVGRRPETLERARSLGIVDAVGGRIPVLIDGGIRRGTDVLKALAIGARAVLVGRPPLWGLGAFGQPGVARVLELLGPAAGAIAGFYYCPHAPEDQCGCRKPATRLASKARCSRCCA